MREMIFNGLKDGLWSAWNWFVSLFELPLHISAVCVFGALCACTVIFASAACAGSIAEKKGHYPHLHMLLALIFPIIYPLILFFALQPVEGSIEAYTRLNKEKREQATALFQAQIAANEKALAEQLQKEEADPTLWSKRRMERIAFNAEGVARGPFVCTLSDGQKVRIAAIQSIQEDIVVFELAGASLNVPGAVVRFPYERIINMELDKQV